MLVAGIMLMFVPKVHQMNKYQKTSSHLQEEIERTVACEKELRQKQQRFQTDPAFVQKIAHEVGYAHKNEKIYQFPDEPGVTNTMENDRNVSAVP